MNTQENIRYIAWQKIERFSEKFKLIEYFKIKDETLILLIQVNRF